MWVAESGNVVGGGDVETRLGEIIVKYGKTPS